MEQKVIRDGKGLMEYINRTNKENGVFNTYKSWDYKGKRAFENHYKREMSKRSKASGYDIEGECYNTWHLFEDFEQ